MMETYGPPWKVALIGSLQSLAWPWCFAIGRWR